MPNSPLLRTRLSTLRLNEGQRFHTPYSPHTILACSSSTINTIILYTSSLTYSIHRTSKRRAHDTATEKYRGRIRLDWIELDFLGKRSRDKVCHGSIFLFFVIRSSRVSFFFIVSSSPNPRPTLDVDVTGENPEYTHLRLETEIETAYLDPRGTGYRGGFTPSILSFSLIYPSSIHLFISVSSWSVFGLCRCGWKAG